MHSIPESRAERVFQKRVTPDVMKIKKFINLLAILLFGIVVYFEVTSPRIYPVHFPTINCTLSEINIQTGKGRYSKYLFFIRTDRRTYATPLSEALDAPVADSQRPSDGWRSVGQFSPPKIRYSPHYSFHSALSQARRVGYFFAVLDLSAEEKAQIAKDILRAWQKQQGDYGAKEIIQKLSDKSDLEK